MKFNRRRITRQIDGNAIFGVDRQSSLAEAPKSRYMDLLRRQQNIIAAGLFDDGLANIVFRARAVGRLRGFAFDGIFELVVREEGRNDLHTEQNQRSEDGETED